ncbi:membrane associated guanylate kinase, WW and PDZ domain containing protein magi isoform X2 [Arctopsyche grandis]|uniref:membrane associated guanylate kinase, WW and PDZ domain containing protein magi isoform X2 n=1 Tax=Arctopsyche grandis TaxID=121162 RepID=UPI00406D654B
MASQTSSHGQLQMADPQRDHDKLSTGGLSSGGLSSGGLSAAGLSVGSVSSATTVAAPTADDRPLRFGGSSSCSSSKIDKEDDFTLGALPPLWEKSYTANGEVYFIDHNTGTSHWLDPRLSRFRKKSLAECREDELPFGWERIECPRYGAYFIDHVNRRTQYENPVLQARRSMRPSDLGSVEREVDSEGISLRSMLSRDPAQLTGHRFTVTLLKSSQGLGFTLVGGASETPDDASEAQSAAGCCDDFLQIKSIVPNSPAWLDGALRTGDLLVRVGSTCVLGVGHARVARLFQEIPPGTSVTLELCRGYPLPFDPNDPNTRVLTTVAVEGGNSSRMRHLTDELRERFNLEDGDKQSQGSSLERSNRSAMNRSYQREHLDEPDELMERPNHLNRSFELEHRMSQLNRSFDMDRLTGARSSAVNRSYDLDNRPETHLVDRLPTRCPSADHLLLDSVSSPYMQDGGVLTLRLMKGAAGFGFTIADSVHGQKVLDRVRCGGLREGDLLVSINQTSVTNMSHAHVVQVLKDCPQKKEATIKVVRRPGYHSKSSGLNNQPKQTGNTKSKLAKDISNLFRSKTPTADLYSTQQKEILPSRPKTPLVDTRNMSAADNYINLGIGYSQEDLNSASTQQISPNSSSSYKFIKKRRNSSNLNTPQSLQSSIIHNSSNSITHSNGGNLEINTNGNLISPMSNSTHYRGSGVGATNDTNSKLDSGNLSNYGNDASETNESVGAMLPLVQTMTLNESNMVAAYGGVSNGNNANSIAGESSDNGGFLEEGPTTSGVSVGTGGSGRGSAAGCFNCYNPGGTDSPLVARSHLQQKNLLMPHHNYDVISPVAVNWSTVDMNSQMEEIIDPEADIVVVLARGAAGFGFRIVGGTEEGSQVAVGHIVPGGACDLDGRICPGDLLTSVDGISTLGVSHRTAVGSVCQAATNGQVTLGIKKSRNNNLGLHMGNVMPVRANQQQQYIAPIQQNHILIDNGHANAESPLGGPPRQYLHSNSNTSGNLYYNYYPENNYVLNGASLPSHERVSLSNVNYDQTDGNSPYPNYYSQNSPGYRLPITNYMKTVQAPYSSSNLGYGEQGLGDIGQYGNVGTGGVPYDVVVQRSENEGFGFVIISSTNKATSTIGQLITGSPAARCGLLHVGDTILAINHTPIRNLSHGDIVTLIKHSGYSVTLTIQSTAH